MGILHGHFNYIKPLIALAGASVTSFLGGWDSGIVTLFIFMVLDYITGMMVAGIFKKSNKTKTGKLESGAGFKGLCKKCVILIFVLVAFRLDKLLKINYITDAVVIGFIINESLSLIENAALMGVPLPRVLKKAIEILQKQGGENDRAI